jgi:folate-binding protein YgfZ
VRATIETVHVKIALRREATSPAGGIPLPSFSTELIEILLEDATPAASPEDHADPDPELEEFLNADLAIQDRDARAGMNPFELGSAVIEQAVSFTKGCYTGQELVARIDARGSSAPFRLVGAVASGAGTFAADEPVMVAGEQVGSVLRGGTRGHHFEGIVRLARKVECPVDGVAGTADVSLHELGEQRPT